MLDRRPFRIWGRSEVVRPRVLVIHHTADTHDEQAGIVEKSHASRGYDESNLGSHIAYHFLIGKDGTVKQNRSLSERTGHTRNQVVNLESIAIVLAGNFQDEEPTREQVISLRSLVKRLDSIYKFEKIIPHRDASPTACPGQKLLDALSDQWRGEKTIIVKVTRYYSPVPGQLRYFHGSYIKDVEINCGLKEDGTPGDCFHVADGSDIRQAKPFTIAACPPQFPFGTKLTIEGIGTVTCRDRGGAIKDNRIDVWAGIGTDGLRNIYESNVAGYLAAVIH